MTTIDDVAELANFLDGLNKEIENLQNTLKIVLERKRVLVEETIPSIMMELGIKDLTLENGKKMSLKSEVYAQIASENKPLCFVWLNEHNFGGLIKTNVIVEFGKGSREMAFDLADELRTNGYNVNFKEDIHAQTLKAFLKEQIKKGNKELPLELFGAKPINIATIK